MIIVLVGPPGAGKTTVLKKIQEKGIAVFSADVFISKIYQVDGEGYNIIKETFGEEYVNSKEVDRSKIRKLIAKDPQNLMLLNEIIHPIIYDYLEGKDNYVAELPIVVNSPIKFKYDALVLVTAKKEILKERLIKRNINNIDFLDSIIEKWSKEIEYDFIIDTSLSKIDQKIDQLVAKFALK